ncbi:unnamed protein product [Lactuca saligna]|uniref:HAT C-terminal dimerisation domain-containing protein n=1 Tax=Lactuca saligna TaxID=75948 RepID=A0AA35UJJ8_LACSI|nr:unnamed protein product [Lactuca saligna]
MMQHTAPNMVDNTEIDNKDGKGQTIKKKKKYVKRAACWADYDELKINNVQHSKCKWCDTLLKIDSGENSTSSMIRHTKRFGELPFKFVENETFIEYTNALNGKVVLPCRTTVSKRVVDYYVEEMAKLNKFFSNPLTNVNLTTDCWTSSCQRSSYMVVTAHLIDKDWVMHKRVINFKFLDFYRGEDIGRTLLTFLEAWDILALKISNVASEATFRTSGWILDPYRTNLSANILEALVCTQYCVRKSRKPIVDNIVEVLKDDDVAKELENMINNGGGNGKQPINIPE